MIIEDDFYNAYRLKNLIREVDDTLEVHGPLKSVEEVVRELSENNDYDLIFSDIRLIDGDVFEAFREVKPRAFVVFITAYEEYALKAFRNNGIDYLLKPVDSEELCKAMEKARTAGGGDREAAQNNMNGLLNETRRYRQRFLVAPFRSSLSCGIWPDSGNISRRESVFKIRLVMFLAEFGPTRFK